MNSSGGRLNTSYYNSVTNLVSNDNKNEEMNSGLFDFNNGVESPNQFLTPFSPSPFMSTYPNQFLDSPSFMFNSNFFSSPPRGNYLGYDFEEEKANVSDLISQSRTSPTTISRSKMEESMKNEVQDWNDKSQPKQIDFSMQISKIEPESESVQSSQKDCELDPIQASKKQSRFEDGYNWRKYGQKQVKGSRKLRSYFKCSYPNCPTKKKVEQDFNGHITEIIYKGKHNHPMPQNMKKRSLNSFENTYYDYSTDKNHLESFSSYSPASFGEADYDHDSSFSKSGNDREYEPNAKRWITDEVESEAISYDGSNTIQESRVVIEMKSDVDILDDGYKWRKYGQKVVKGNPNPRSYYRCTNIGCPVRKLVERASHDLESVITTYEGKHNHGLPSRGGGSYAATNQPPKSNITNTSNNRMLETSTPFSDYAYNVHGMRALSNEDWVRGKFLSKTKEEPENEFIYNSF